MTHGQGPATSSTEADAASPGTGFLEDGRCLDLPDSWEAPPQGRRFVEREVLARGGAAVVDDAILIAAELLANGRQHGIPPVQVCVKGGAGHIRIEVCDSSSRGPVRRAPSPDNMTGRGLAIVEALATRGGVTALPHGRKSVWAELASAEVLDAAPAEPPYVETVAAGAHTEPRFPVVLGDVPTALLIEAKAQMDNMVRELSLAGAVGTRSSSAPLPS